LAIRGLNMDCDTFDGVVEMFEQHIIQGCIANEFKCTYTEETGEFIAEINGKFYVAMIREKK
jgi:hypothetical protein